MKRLLKRFFLDVGRGKFRTVEEALAAAERWLKPKLTPEQWAAILEILKVVLPILLGLL